MGETNEWFVGEDAQTHVAGGAQQSLPSPDRQGANRTDPDFVEAIEMLKDTMQQNGWFMGGLDRVLTTATDDERRGGTR